MAQIHLVGLGDAGLWTLLARSQSTRVSRTVIDLNNFSAADDQAWMTTCYIPGIRRAGDIRTAAALAAPGDLLLMNTGADFDPDWAQAGYAAAQATPNLRIAQESVSESDLIQFLSGSSAP